jgi:nucleoid-associated protein YgaU
MPGGTDDADLGESMPAVASNAPAYVQGASSSSSSTFDSTATTQPSSINGGSLPSSSSTGFGASARSNDIASNAVAGGARTHTVRPGENYSTIAAAAYGNAAYYPHLIRANPTIDARKLRPGMVINLPPISEVRADGAQTASASTPRIDERTEYRVQPGDSLERISIKLYGKRDRTEKLHELNRSLIGANPARLKPGMILKLPEPPTRL